jgi:hypothetical protein
MNLNEITTNQRRVSIIALNTGSKPRRVADASAAAVEKQLRAAGCKAIVYAVNGFTSVDEIIVQQPSKLHVTLIGIDCHSLNSLLQRDKLLTRIETKLRKYGVEDFIITEN